MNNDNDNDNDNDNERSGGSSASVSVCIHCEQVAVWTLAQCGSRGESGGEVRLDLLDLTCWT